MSRKVLVTGGAGFIGRHVARALLERGNDVRILDSLIEQVHGGGEPDEAVLEEVEFLRGDVRDLALVGKAIRGVDSVIHLAAEVGVGQSMYAIDRYVSANDLGTGVLFQALIDSPVRRVVVASSMSIYGEGLYRRADGSLADDVERRAGTGSWEVRDADGGDLTPVPTPEWKRASLASVYALTKYAQERMTLIAAPAYGMEACALRLFNVFGPGQALSNPYTGVLAIFASRLLNGKPPLIFEDGKQRRDFVHVNDVAEAFTLALDAPAAAGGVFNVGSGRNYSVEEVAVLLAEAMGRDDIGPQLVGKGRVGDIRHCFADISRAESELGFRPRRFLETGLDELAAWVESCQAVDLVAEARAELERRGLVA